MALQPSMEEKGITTIRLHRLHFSSSPCPRTFAISWPHSQRVSLSGEQVVLSVCEIAMAGSLCNNEIENDY